jgi:hypothetical protein
MIRNAVFEDGLSILSVNKGRPNEAHISARNVSAIADNNRLDRSEPWYRLWIFRGRQLGCRRPGRKLDYHRQLVEWQYDR